MAENVLFNLESEKTVLGAMLCSNKVCASALGILEEEDFYDSKVHRTIFRAIKNLSEGDNKVDCASVILELQNNMKAIDQVGGADFLYEISELYIGDKNSEFHVTRVHDLGLLRKIFSTASKLEKEYKEEQISDISDFIEKYDTSMSALTRKRASGEFKSGGEVIANIEKEMTEISKRNTKSTLVGIPTGFRLLDLYTSGWQGGQLIILAARPSVGKTALAINFLYNAAKTGKTVAFFSLEMSAEDIIRRLLANRSGVSFKAIKTGNMETDQDWMAIEEAKRDINKCHIWVDDTSGIKIGEIKTKATKLKAKDPNLGLIIIDYMGLININNTRKENREKIDEISRSLKGLARDIDVPVLCLCQLSRANEKENRKPILSDLRDSGSIEQDADIVMFIHRKSYQNQKENTPQEAAPTSEETEIILAKNRNGQVGTVLTNFVLSESRFYDITKEN